MNELPKTRITERAALRARYREPSETVRRKVMPRLDKHARAFIAKSPFLCIGTAAAGGKADVSPRGDPPGFVQVLDDATILIPDRPGNNRLDSMQNIIENPRVGLIFFLPGVEETLRLDGRAEIVAGHPALASCEVNGKTPEIGILVHVEHAHLHCAKALKRAKLWDPASRIDRKSFPTLGQMITDQISDLGVTAEEADANLEKAYRKLY
jgi:PPOX class probable FMN-dependent enzyme